MYRISLFVCICLIPVLGFGQSSELGNWFIFFGNKNINDKLYWHHEVQYRNYDFIGDLEQLLLRTGLGYRLSQDADVLGGYGFIRSENYAGDDEKMVVNEHRIYQQFIAKQKVRQLRLQHRYRFEQRFVEDDFRLRFRYFLGLAHPIWQSDSDDKQLYLSAYNELFINTEDTIFDRNRLYGGLGYRLNTTFRFELGYMNQFFSIGGRDQLNVVTFINW